MNPPLADTPDAELLAATLIEITRSVTHGAETIDIFTDLAQRCVNLLPVSGAGILLRDASGSLQVIGSSSPSAHMLDLFQVQNEQGPCLECSDTGEPVSDEELGEGGPWPRFAALAQASGFRAVYALPLRSRDVTVGALNLFSTQGLSSGQLVVAQSLADAATVSLLQVDPQVDLQIVIRRIHVAVQSRNALEQAQGMLVQRYSIDVEEAFVRLHGAAKATQLSLMDVVTAVITRDGSSPVSRYLSND